MRKFFSSYVFLCLVNVLLGNTENDSLTILRIQSEIAEAADTQKLRLLDEYSWKFRVRENELAEELALEGIALAKSLGDSTRFHLIGQNLGVIYAVRNEFAVSKDLLQGAVYFFAKVGDNPSLIKTLTSKAAIESFKGDNELAEKTYERLSQLVDTSDSNWDYLNLLLERGLNFFYWKKYSSAKELFLKALPISRNLKDTATISKLLLNLGLIEDENDKFAAALTYYFKALKFGKGDFFLAKLYNNIGSSYFSIGDLDKAFEYYEKSLELKRKFGFPHGIAQTLNNLGNVHMQKKDYGTALEFYQESVDLKLNMEGSNTGLAQSYNNIGITNLELGDFKNAEAAFLKAETASLKENDEYSRGEALNNLGDTYLKTEQYQKAVNYATQSLDLAKELEDFITQKNSNKILSESYEALKNFQLSHRYLQEHLSAKDTLIARSNHKLASKLEGQYFLEQQEETLENQETLLNSSKEREELFQQRNILLLIGLLSLIIITILGFIYQKQRLKKIQQAQELALAKSDADALKIKLLETELAKNQWALDNYLNRFLEKTKLLDDLNQKLVAEIGEQRLSNLENLSTALKENLTSENNYETFQYYFSLVHRDFFKNVTKKYGSLSPQELNLCALIKINMVNKDIAKIFGISTDSVKKAKQRLYKKLGLEDNNALRITLMEL